MNIISKTIITATTIALSMSATSAWAINCPASAKATLTLKVELAPSQRVGVDTGLVDRYTVNGILNNAVLDDAIPGAFFKMTTIHSGKRIALPAQYKATVKAQVGRSVDSVEASIRAAVKRVCPNTTISIVNKTGY